MAGFLDAVLRILGAFTGNGGAAQGDSVKASLDLAHTDIDSIISKVDTVDGLQDVPSPDSVDNNQMRDVIGNKSDTHDGDSTYAHAQTLLAHVHSLSQLFPTMRDGVAVPSGGAWVLGAETAIIGGDQNLDNTATENPSGTRTRIAMTAHGYVVGNFVNLNGMDDIDGTWEILFIVGVDSFDIDAGQYTQQTPPGDATEVVRSVIPNDFDIHHVSIEALDDNTVYELTLYDDGVECGKCRFTKNANLDAVMNIPIQTPIIAAESVITAKLASAAGSSSATISLFYHIY